MLNQIEFNWTTLRWFVWPAVVVIVGFAAIFLLWRSVLKKGKTCKYPAATLMAPINAALSVSGLIIPLLTALIAYLVQQGGTVSKLFPVVVSLGFAGLAVVAGLWNLFSMTSSDGESFEITKDKSALFVPCVVGQFLLLFNSFAVLVVFFLFSYQLEPQKASYTQVSQSPVLVARSPVRVGMDRTTLLASWGSPAKEETHGGTNVWRYEASESEFAIEIVNDKIQSVIERRK